MKLSKGKIILIVVVVYFIIFAIINVNKEKNYNKDILEQVVYVKDAKVNPENEGKIVLVSGKIEYDNLVSFIELDENFGTIKINRKVEDYKNDKWVIRTEIKENTSNYIDTILSDEKISNIKIGDFELDSKGKSLIPTDKFYGSSESVLGLVNNSFNYSTHSDEEEAKEGDVKLTYKYYELDKNPNISILAVQKGNSFEPYKVDNKTEVYEVFLGTVDNESALTHELNQNVKGTIKGKSLFIIMIIGVGIFFIVDNKKKK